ncbi:MAG: DUF4238 domain-containing protein [Pseudanabaena sp. Salubria-1]|nr:DUF4238 domain-containing protein [Pseudanabaena sp. Salubria-1]
MSSPKLHHYVPRFYLKQFADKKECFWVWNKNTKKVFKGNPYGVAAEQHFYRVPEFIGSEYDPLFLEHNLSKLEFDTSIVMNKWLESLNSMQIMEKLLVTPEERRLLSVFISVQFLRTAQQRDILALFSKLVGQDKSDISPNEKINLHAYMLCSSGLVEEIAERIEKSIWLFSRNDTEIPFWTSDNPVCFKTGDNRMWLKGMGIMSEGSYIVYPINPHYVLYCKEPNYWAMLKKLDCYLSPVKMTPDMIEHENAGQVFMATRFVISPNNNFSFANEFIETIGTDIYAPKNS